VDGALDGRLSARMTMKLLIRRTSFALHVESPFHPAFGLHSKKHPHQLRTPIPVSVAPLGATLTPSWKRSQYKSRAASQECHSSLATSTQKVSVADVLTAIQLTKSCQKQLIHGGL
jgi:hypothetical protein